MILRKQVSIAGFLALFFAIVGIVVYNYMYQEHRDIASASFDFELHPILLKKVMSNASESVNYVDKVIQTEGTITAIEQNSVIIDNEVQVNFNEKDITVLSINNKITVKGRCVGYDDLLELVKLDQAIVIKN